MISRESLLPYSSEYLAHGFREDSIVLGSVDFAAPRICAYFEVKEFYSPLDGVFHLSATSAMNCIGQAGVVYAGLDGGTGRRAGEIYLSEIDIRFNKPVRTTMFTVELLCRDRVERRHSVRYSVTGSVQQGCFELTAEFVVPRASEDPASDSPPLPTRPGR